VRGGFIEAFRLAKEGKFADVDAIEVLEGGQSIRTKSVYVYFPESLLPIYSAPHISHFAQLFGGDPGQRGIVAANNYLHDLLTSTKEFAGWSGLEIMRFLYDWADPRETIKVLKIAPGERARFWDQCVAGGYISVGWPDVGDLRQYSSVEDYRQRFIAAYGPTYGASPSTASKKANEVWKLAELDPGDIIVANRGTSEVVGIGTVIEPGYVWRPELGEYAHTVTVHWDDTETRTIEPIKAWATTTVARVPADLYTKIRGSGGEHIPKPPISAPNELMASIESALRHRGQVILYGPPGTGKTRAALEFADWWLMAEGVDSGSGSRKKQLRQVSFHPSYSYEDFVEGYRPKANVPDGLALELRPGLFKEVCKNAQSDEQHRYLLIIDEINRGNVPKIFGELITLLELDKRGKEVTLPQSGEMFSVPKNVYIVGTMNTADRSIRVLDAALRRRFAFIELMPEPGLLDGEGPEGMKVNVVLEHLNSRIAKSEGREKQVGHSYFMDGSTVIKDAAEFSRRFRQELIPLLQEFCYDDYAKLAEFVGRDIVDVEAQMLNEEIVNNPAALIEALVKELGKP
jgi:5-methylcytosine-specific restriction protein B